MKNTIYSCDLCRYKFDVENLMGFEFSGDILVVKDSQRVERHWCQVCSKAIKSMVHSVGFMEFVSREIKPA